MFVITNIEEIEKREKKLKKVNIDPVNWLIYFLDNETGEKWLKEYLHPKIKGSDVPLMRKIDKFPWE